MLINIFLMYSTCTLFEFYIQQWYPLFVIKRLYIHLKMKCLVYLLRIYRIINQRWMFENVKFGPFNVLTWYRHRRQVTRVNRIMTVMYFMNVISFSFSFPTCTRDQEQLLNRIFCLHNTNNKRNYTADASPLDQTQGFSYLHTHTCTHSYLLHFSRLWVLEISHR